MVPNKVPNFFFYRSATDTLHSTIILMKPTAVGLRLLIRHVLACLFRS